jgi:hypothetical protein
MNTQAAPDCLTVTLAGSRVDSALRAIVKQLLEDGFGVYYYLPERRHENVTWIVVERGGNVGNVSYDRISGYSVTFAIKPTKGVGSGLSILADNYEPAVPTTVQAVVLAAGLATQDTYKNWVVSKAMPNHGWAHFDWAKDRFHQVVKDEDGGTCAQCGNAIPTPDDVVIGVAGVGYCENCDPSLDHDDSDMIDARDQY